MQIDVILNAGRFFMSRIIPALFLTLIAILYSRKLTASDYGAYQAIWTYLSICVVFTSFGFPKYILTLGNGIDKNLFDKALRIFILVLLFTLIPIAFFLFFKSSYFDFATSSYFVLLLISQTIYFIQEAIVLNSHEGVKIVWPNIIYSLLLLVVHLFVIYVLPFKLSNCVLGIASVSIIRNIIVWKLFTSKVYLQQEPALSQKPDLSLIFWLGINDFLQVLTKWLDKFLLLFFLPSAEFAIYYNGTFELPLIGMFLTAFQMIITVQSSKDNEVSILFKTYRDSTLLLSSILFPLFVWIFFYSSQIVQILFSRKYLASSELFAFSALLFPVRICNYTVLLQIKNKGKEILSGSIIDLLISGILMVLLYPLLNLKGLVLALAIATYIQAAYYLYQIKKEYNVALKEIFPFNDLFFRLLFCVVFLFTIKNIFNFLFPNFNFLIGSVVSFGLFVFYLKKSLEPEVIKKILLKSKI